MIAYELIRPLVHHYVYRVACDPYKEESHKIEVYWAPVVLQEHIRISGDEYD
jgi:hypothetical protein